jgi:hypothetical protein
LEVFLTCKTPRSTKAVRNLYKKLKREGHVDEDAGELAFVAEKFACSNEILRKENEDFRIARWRVKWLKLRKNVMHIISFRKILKNKRKSVWHKRRKI